MRPSISVHPKGARLTNIGMSFWSLVDDFISLLSLGFLSSDFALWWGFKDLEWKTRRAMKKEGIDNG